MDSSESGALITFEDELCESLHLKEEEKKKDVLAMKLQKQLPNGTLRIRKTLHNSLIKERIKGDGN